MANILFTLCLFCVCFLKVFSPLIKSLNVDTCIAFILGQLDEIFTTDKDNTAKHRLYFKETFSARRQFIMHKTITEVIMQYPRYKDMPGLVSMIFIMGMQVFLEFPLKVHCSIELIAKDYFINAVHQRVVDFIL